MKLYNELKIGDLLMFNRLLAAADKPQQTAQSISQNMSSNQGNNSEYLANTNSISENNNNLNEVEGDLSDETDSDDEGWIRY